VKKLNIKRSVVPNPIDFVDWKQ